MKAQPTTSRSGFPRPLRAALLAAALLPAAARAQLPADKTPDELKGVRIDEKLNAQVPLDLVFYDETGQQVTLGKYFDGKKPVILTLNYYACPMLCGLQLNGLLDCLKEMDWLPGREFEIVTVSFDPLETPKLAKSKKQNYMSDYGRPGAERGWHFLTGRKDEIRALTDATGFHYRWNDERNEWAHAAALIVLTPDGHISRYLGGLVYEQKTLRLTLVEASQGKVGSLWDQVFLWCHTYDPENGYTLMATNVMRVGGSATAVVLGICLLALWRLDARRRRRAGIPVTNE